MMTQISKKLRDKIGLTELLNQLHIHCHYGKLHWDSVRLYQPHEKEELTFEWNQLAKVLEFYRNHPNIIKEIQDYLRHIDFLPITYQSIESGVCLDLIQLYDLKRQLICYKKIYTLGSQYLHDVLTLPSLDKPLKVLDPTNEGISHFSLLDLETTSLHEIVKKKKEILAKKKQGLTDQQEIEDELKQVLIDEDKESQRLMLELTNSLRPYMSEIRSGMELIGYLDFLIAKGILTDSSVCTQPNIGEYLHIDEMYHPLIAIQLEEQGTSFQKIDIELKEGATVISGANMGGKTLTLKSLLLNISLGLMGFYVYGTNVTLPMFEALGGLLKGHEREELGLSSFGTELVLLDTFMKENKDKNYFYVIDEFARGTNPKEGQLLTRALLKYCQHRKGILVVTSHYDGICHKDMVHYQVKGLCSSLDKAKDVAHNKTYHIQAYMDYSLHRVDEKTPVPCDGIRIATLLGIDKELMKLIENEGGREYGHDSID